MCNSNYKEIESGMNTATLTRATHSYNHQLKEHIMSSDVSKFTDAVYQKKQNYDFGKTDFTRRELKILLTIDGKKSVAEVACLLASDADTLMPDFARLVKLGLIQTEGGIISAGISDVLISEVVESDRKFTIGRLSTAIVA